MNRPITATEVQMRLDEWDRVNRPIYEARLNKVLDAIWGNTLRFIEAHLRDQDLQQQRMTDDGCPLTQEK